MRLQQYLRERATPDLELPPRMSEPPRIGWAGALRGFGTATTLPRGRIVPVSSPLIGGPIRSAFEAWLPGGPEIDGHPALAAIRRFAWRGESRSGSSINVHRIRTDAPVIEVAGVTPDGGGVVTTLIVDGRLVPPTIMSAGRHAGGWTVGSIRIDFGARALRDVWIETGLAVAYFKVDQGDIVEPSADSDEPQLTAVGDSYLGFRSPTFGNQAAILLEAGARLGIRKLAVDAAGGIGYWNSNGGMGNLLDRVVGHGRDRSQIYLVVAGLNDYGDIEPGGGLVFPSAAVFENAVAEYFQRLRAANPTAVIVATAPLCPVPSLSDSSYVVNATTNPSGRGDFLYKSDLFRQCLERAGAPWVFVDVLMGGGWTNSSGRGGDVTGLQWFTGGAAAPGTTATHRPGNTGGRGGGGFGGIESVPVLEGGRYTQAPDVVATGGSGRGALLVARIDGEGRVFEVVNATPGLGYTAGAGLPSVTLDSTHARLDARGRRLEAVLGTPVLGTGFGADGMYPLPEFAPPGVSRSDLNNIYVLLAGDGIHPSPAGCEYLGRRLARNIHDAILAL